MITSLGVLIGLTVILFGGCAVMTGQALASSWRPGWLVLPYGLMLGAADRFFGYALFEGELLSTAGWLLDSAILITMALAAFRLIRAGRMVSQYPWLYHRTGPFSWRTFPPNPSPAPEPPPCGPTQPATGPESRLGRRSGEAERRRNG